MGDRFYGSPALIAWCRAQGWDWRLRLKQDLLVFEAGGETTLAACFARGEHLLSLFCRGKRAAKSAPSAAAISLDPAHPRPPAAPNPQLAPQFLAAPARQGI